MSSNSCTENRKLKHFSLQLHLLLISRSPQHPKAKSNESEIPNSWAPGRDSHRTSGNASAFFSRMVCGATGRQHHVWNLGYDWLISERRPIRCCVTWFDVFLYSSFWLVVLSPDPPVVVVVRKRQGSPFILLLCQFGSGKGGVNTCLSFVWVFRRERATLSKGKVSIFASVA